MPRNKRSRQIRQRARASGRGAVYQAGRDQHIYVSPHSSPAPQATAALPAAPVMLVGRDHEVRELQGLLRPNSDEQQPNIIAVTGLPGVGKTAVVLHAAQYAHQVAKWFPGGVLFADLRGYDTDGHVGADQVLGAWIRALGVRDADVPVASDERSALYQSLLNAAADDSGPALLVADNVSNADQVRPLIPARRQHRLLITSRDTLTLLPARFIDLNQLNLGPAGDLITGLISRARPDDRRPETERDAFAGLAEACGRLPLALEIAADVLVGDPGMSVADLAIELVDERAQLAEGSAGLIVTGRLAPVRAAFDLSYRRLAAAPARMFRLLSVNAGPDISTEAAASLARQPPRQVRTLLATLGRAGLVREQPVGGGRWQMHDLIRVYAAELARRASSERKAAVGRLVDYYLTVTVDAWRQLAARPGQDAVLFGTRAEALAWVDRERPNLAATLTLAAANGRDEAAAGLALVLIPFLDRSRRIDDEITTAQTGLDAARRIEDRQAEAELLSALGVALARARRFDEAVTFSRQAVALMGELGDDEKEAKARVNLGVVLIEARRFDEGIVVSQQAADRLVQLGDHHAAAGVQVNVGRALREVRRFGEAISACEQAADVFVAAQDDNSEAAALGNLGMVFREVGRLEEAATAHRRAAHIFAKLDDRFSEAQQLGNLGLVLRQLRRFDEAIAAHRRAGEIFADFGDRHSQAVELNNLGLALCAARHHDEAIAACRSAAEEARQVGDEHLVASALGNLGGVLQEVGRLQEAAAAHQQASTIFADLGDTYGEAKELRNLGLALKGSRLFDQAIAAFEQAACRYAAAANDDGEALALANLRDTRIQEREDRTGNVRTRWRRFVGRADLEG